MEALPGDPYERQLLAVFKSCDFNGRGLLDNDGLLKLCELLDLDDGKEQLMSSLFPNNCSSPAVSFIKFKDALVTLLGGIRDQRSSSPDREVSPKYVYGEKKYGRRSRPESTEQLDKDPENDFKLHSSNSTSHSSLMSDSPDLILNDVESNEVANVLKESDRGESELRSAWERLGVGRDGYLHPNELAMVCSAVGMDTMADQVVNQVFITLKTDDDGRISFEEFLQLFHKSRPSSPQLLENSQRDSDITSSCRLFQELQITRSHLEAVTAERDKLRSDLADANHRATILAQEIDDHHARIEKAARAKADHLEHRHSEEMKEFKKQASIDKENILSTNHKLEKSLSQNQDELNKLQSELSSLKKEYDSLEKENQVLNTKIVESKKMKQQYENHLECMNSLQQKVYELELLHEQSVDFEEKMKTLQKLNTELRDKNDELTIQLEQMARNKRESADFISGFKRRGKSPETVPEARSKVRRYCTENDLTSVEINEAISFLDDFDDLLDASVPTSSEYKESELYARIAELEAKIEVYEKKEWLWHSDSHDGCSFKTCQSSDTQTSCSGNSIETAVQTESPLGHLEKHCHELENELERVRDKIIKILTERKVCNEENCVLKQTLQTLMKNNLIDDCDNNILKASLKFLPETKEREIQIELNNETLCLDKTDMCLKCSNSKTELDSLKDDNRILAQRCLELEENLELLRIEYEKTEDYWANKLDDERKLFEIDQQQSDEKFIDLEAKILEYSELLASEQKKKPSLPPIDEKDDLEKQFTDLEEEFLLYKLKIEPIIIQKEETIRHLEKSLSTFQNANIKECKDRGVQVDRESLKFNTKHRYSASTSRDFNLKPSDNCWCGRTKARERLKYEIDMLSNRKNVLINQIAILHANIKLSSPKFDNSHALNALNNKVKQYEKKLKDLESSLMIQRKQTEQIFSRSWEKQQQELTKLQSSITATQKQFKQHQLTSKAQLDRLSTADSIIKELSNENHNLIATISTLENKLSNQSTNCSI